ncbi:MAG TPA: hypothetical protein VEC99_04690, partial [Clostridia bacterium]|nr:hypothetical protein [Clostridia bacterium]
MKTHIPTILFAMLLMFASSLLAQTPLNAGFTYQGRLAVSGQTVNGTYSMKFTLFDAAVDGDTVGTPVINDNVAVSNGLFTTTLDFGSGVFAGQARWLEIGIRSSVDGSFTTLSPRQELTPTPNASYALVASTAASAEKVAPGSITTSSLAAGAVAPATIANGTVVRSINGKTDNVTIPTNFWSLAGNSGTSPADFIGTTDRAPLEFRINGQRALRLEPAAPETNGVPSVNIVGGEANSIEFDASGGVVAGGWSNTLQFRASGSIIGGGAGNTISSNANYSVIAGGLENTNSSRYSAIVGGLRNRAGAYAAVVGGTHNFALGNGSFIGGGTRINSGTNNYASGLNSSVLGGSANAAYGRYSAVLGGENNEAGDYATAAGRRAKALHWGSFVWADSTDADFTSTANNQFLIRASGNVGINTTTPQSTLDVAGTVTANSFSGSGAGLTGIGANAISDGAVGSAKLANDAGSLSKVSAGQISSVDANVILSTDLFLSNHDFFLRGYNDRDHGLAYFGQAGVNKPFAGVNVDGPVLFGYNGGALAIKQASNNKSNVVLYWNSAGKV